MEDSGRPGRPSKIVDEGEAKRWLIDEERPYKWIIDTYRTKYNIETSAAMWSRARQRLGAETFRSLPRSGLMPWTVRGEAHRTHYIPHMLRMVDRVRRGEATREDEGRAASFLERLNSMSAVVHYDPETTQGWFLVPRESYDKDIIRDPKHVRNPQARTASASK